MNLSKRYLKALEFAFLKHNSQSRKGSNIPYFSHVSAVSCLTMEYGATEEQAVAALLHDTIEDCGVKKEELELHFGELVARIVVECTDAEQIPKPPWHERKKKYLDHLEVAHPETYLVSACDKLHNARAIIRDVTYLGPTVWQRFKAKPKDILWYYESLLEIFERKMQDNLPLVGDYRSEVQVMRQIVDRAVG